MFFQRQKTSDSCRFDAINNYLQRNKLTYRDSRTYFEEFKKLYPFAHMNLTHNEDGTNFITFLLQKFTGKIHRIVDEVVRKKLIADNKIPSFIVYNRSHCWCIIKVDDKYYELNGLNTKPLVISIDRARQLFQKYHCIIS